MFSAQINSFMQISSTMKKFIIKVIAFFCIIFVADILLGYSFSCMVKNAIGGNNGRINFICNQTNEELLVFGSSRADHHYNSEILMDSLGLTCYNCGEDGNGIILNYGRFQMMLRRYRPRLIIYDIAPSFDLLSNDNHKFIGMLKPYYEREGVKDIFLAVDYTEKWKMMSQLYRYNSIFLTIMADRFHPIQSMGFQGFRPLKGELDRMKVRKLDKTTKEYQFDSLKIEFFNKFIDKAEGIKLVFVESPVWYGMNTIQLTPIRDICIQRNIPFIDYSNNPKYVGNDELFKDGTHLNARGADEFTKDLILELKRRNVIE